ncbi:uncharacterized protein G2W53_007452 [Senna tora]|uniref:Uncharacterized protein n=1 Tax=Senna tora TaxID=362788 RepID=A0A834X6U4_9FABA|nr:uncharacterized protein G2W53_007452 [Senna tora]
MELRLEPSPIRRVTNRDKAEDLRLGHAGHGLWILGRDLSQFPKTITKNLLYLIRIATRFECFGESRAQHPCPLGSLSEQKVLLRNQGYKLGIRSSSVTVMTFCSLEPPNRLLVRSLDASQLLNNWRSCLFQHVPPGVPSHLSLDVLWFVGQQFCSLWLSFQQSQFSSETYSLHIGADRLQIVCGVLILSPY